MFTIIDFEKADIINDTKYFEKYFAEYGNCMINHTECTIFDFVTFNNWLKTSKQQFINVINHLNKIFKLNIFLLFYDALCK